MIQLKFLYITTKKKYGSYPPNKPRLSEKKDKIQVIYVDDSSIWLELCEIWKIYNVDSSLLDIIHYIDEYERFRVRFNVGLTTPKK